MKELQQVENPKPITPPTPVGQVPIIQQLVPGLLIEFLGVFITMLGTRGAYNLRQKILLVGLGIVLIILGFFVLRFIIIAELQLNNL